MPPQLPARPVYEVPDIAKVTAGEKVRVSFSELACFRECPLKWLLRYGYRLDPPVKSIRLDRGSAWHLMSQTHYEAIAAGADQAKTRELVKQAMNDYLANVTAVEDEEYVRLLWMYDGYVSVYGADPDYRLVRAEADFEFPMPVEGAPGLVIVGKIDLETIHVPTGVRDVWDHKSASGRDVSKDGYLNEMLLEDQFILYAAAKRLAGEPVKHVIYNASRTDKLKRAMSNQERFVRAKIAYSAGALDAVWEDATAAATALVRMWNEPDRVYSVPDPQRCGWKCDYQRAHIAARSLGRPTVELAIDYGFVPRGAKAVAQVEEDEGW